MTKEKLVQLLSVLSDDTPVKAEFQFDRAYTSAYSSSITGINFAVGEGGVVSAVICVKEERKAAAGKTTEAA